MSTGLVICCFWLRVVRLVTAYDQDVPSYDQDIIGHSLAVTTYDQCCDQLFHCSVARTIQGMGLTPHLFPILTMETGEDQDEENQTHYLLNSYYYCDIV